jgi:hypothetical protein
VNEPLDGDGFVLRRATPADLDFIVELSAHEDVEPYMAAMAAREPGEAFELAEPTADAGLTLKREVELLNAWRASH